MRNAECGMRNAKRGIRASDVSIPQSAIRIPHLARAFTLVEILVVVAIIGVVMAISIPSLYRQLHADSLSGAVDAVLEACRTARGRAILEGVPMELVIRPLDRTMQVGAAMGNVGASPAGGAEAGTQTSAPAAAPSEAMSGRISDRIAIEILDVNFIEYKEEDAARVRFYPNGTSDEFTIVLRKDGDWRKISLEVVTAMADVETDPRKWMR